MSVSQLKKRFEEFSTYLHKDAEGQKRLKQIKDEVNELRVALREAQEQKAQADTFKDAARERADKAEAELAELKLKFEQLDQTYDSLAYQHGQVVTELTELRMSMDDGDDDVQDVGKELTEQRMRTLMKNIRAQQRYLPKVLERPYRFTRRVGVFSLEELLVSTSRHDLYLFGAKVMMLSLFEPICIRAHHRLRDLHLEEGETMSPAGRMFLEWFTMNNCEEGYKEGYRLSDLTTDPSLQELAREASARALGVGQ